MQRVIAAFGNEDIIGSVPDNGHEKWKEAAFEKPLARLRELIRALRASGKRREAFYQNIVEGNERSRFYDQYARSKGQRKPVLVPPKALLRDVDTRWDSVYFMVERAHLLRPVRFFVILSSSKLTPTFHRPLRTF